MKAEHNELLARLYALRAGLSAVSEKKDEVTHRLEKRDSDKQKFSEEEAAQNQEAAALQEELDFRSLSKDEAYSKYYRSRGGTREEKYKKYYDANINQQRYHKEIHENALRSYRRKWKLCACLAAFFAILTAAFSYCYVAVAPQFLWGIIGGGVLFLLCLFLIWLNKNSEDLNITFIERFEKSIKEAEIDIASKTERLAAVNERLSLIPCERDKILNSANTAVNADVAECDALYAALRSNFSSLLDERDWKNVDLIIFYFETGRADNFKEALQQVDREIQTDRIVGAIQNAGALISQTIYGGLSAIRSDMVKCFSLLSEQIDENARRQCAAIENLSEQLKDISSQAEKISSQTEKMFDFARSLEAKASVSSRQLVQDLHYMRTLAENEEIRRRNGLA